MSVILIITKRSGDLELNQGPFDRYSLQSNALPTELSPALLSPRIYSVLMDAVSKASSCVGKNIMYTECYLFYKIKKTDLVNKY